MENEQIADQILAILTELLQIAGPEWVMEFLQSGIEAAGQGREEIKSGSAGDH